MWTDPETRRWPAAADGMCCLDPRHHAIIIPFRLHGVSVRVSGDHARETRSLVRLVVVKTDRLGRASTEDAALTERERSYAWALKW